MTYVTTKLLLNKTCLSSMEGKRTRRKGNGDKMVEFNVKQHEQQSKIPHRWILTQANTLMALTYLRIIRIGNSQAQVLIK